MTQRIKILYIAGSGRSGSTLLTNLLGQVPGIVGVGELYEIWGRGFIDHQLCGCSRDFPNCPFWTRVLALAYSKHGMPDPVEMKDIATQMRRIKRMFPIWASDAHRQRVQTYMTNIIRLYEAIHLASGSKVIVEESKLPTYALELLKARELDIHVLHLVRDSRAVAYSWRRMRRRPEYPDDNPWMYRNSVAQSSYLWIMWNFLSERLGSITHRHYLRLRYEDLVEEPARAILNILQFLEMPNPPLRLEELLEFKHTVHTVWGNPMRFERPISIRPDLEWRTGLPLQSRLLVEAMTWPFLCHYGYFRRKSSHRTESEIGGKRSTR
jgi:hypothetical protein